MRVMGDGGENGAMNLWDCFAFCDTPGTLIPLQKSKRNGHDLARLILVPSQARFTSLVPTLYGHPDVRLRYYKSNPNMTLVSFAHSTNYLCGLSFLRREGDGMRRAAFSDVPAPPEPVIVAGLFANHGDVHFLSLVWSNLAGDR